MNENKLNQINISQCNSSHEENWDQFLLQHPAGSFYHLYGWKEIIEKNFGHKTFYLQAKQNEETVGVFPFVYLNSRLFGKILCSMPFVNYGGPCSNTLDIAQSLIRVAQSISDSLSADYLEIRSLDNIEMNLPTSKDKVSMTIELGNDHETLWKDFTSKHRTNIRRVYKNGVVIKSGGIELLNDFYSILAESWRFLGTPIYSKYFFQSILETFPKNTTIYVCYYKDEPIATAFNGFFNDTVEGMWAGTNAKYRNLQANYALYWEMIKDACDNGHKYFHLGRSSVESGGEQYKKKWNAVTKQLYWQYHLGTIKNMPELNVKNPKYQLAIKLWKKLPLPVTTVIGPFLAKSIP